jgi:hypothetical protein
MSVLKRNIDVGIAGVEKLSLSAGVGGIPGGPNFNRSTKYCNDLMVIAG